MLSAHPTPKVADRVNTAMNQKILKSFSPVPAIGPSTHEQRAGVDAHVSGGAARLANDPWQPLDFGEETCEV